jgi:hypothetical protein
LGDVYGRFHDDIINYHSSTIVELLNNIRWGIHDYLLPEFRRSFRPDPTEPFKCAFLAPADIHSALAVNCYWGL